MAYKRSFLAVSDNPPDGGNALILTGTPEKLIKKREAKARKLQLELNKHAREIAKDEENRRERAKRERPVTVLTVSHQPTYSVIQYRRLKVKKIGNRLQHFLKE